MKNDRRLIELWILALILSACAPFSPAALSTNTPETSATLIPTPTMQQLTSISPVASGTPGNPNGGASQVITLKNNNQAMTLHINETFLLNLGDMYDWVWQIDNQAVISQEVNVAVIKGAQGIFKAHQRGDAELTAAGDPKCRSQKPACGMPSILFTLHIEVLP